jgi:hypothetical protein
MPERTCIMISSTLLDLAEHRKDVLEACLRQGMEPMCMERLPESDTEAVRLTLDMADRADVYLGLLAHSYGRVPQGHTVSLVELEYKRAVERGIPCLMFLIDREHPIRIEDVEMGEGAARLAALKARVKAASTFKSPADLRQQIITHLAALRKPDLLAFHYVGEIPAPPEAYIAHPYTLLQTRDLVGRQAELNALTDWATGRGEAIRPRHGRSIERPHTPQQWGLVAARNHRRELGAPEPALPPFDASKFEPMPEVDINPHDEYFVEPTEDQ